MTLVRTRTMILFTILLSLFGLFTSMIIDGQVFQANPEDRFSINSVISDIGSLFSDETGIIQKLSSSISIFWRLPIAILKVVFNILAIPFLGFKYLPVLVSTIIYIPYSVIMFFDVVVPLTIKFFEVLGDYIPFT